MKNPLIVGAVCFLLLAAQAFLWASVVVFQLPGAQANLAIEVNLELPVKVVPVLLTYYPELNGITYESAAGYCEYRNVLSMDLEAEGITEDYVCEILDQGLVSNTEELRVYLARQVVQQKVDEQVGAYRDEVSALSQLAIIFFVMSAVLAGISFAVTYFASPELLGGGFQFSIISSVAAFANMVLSGICFLLLPGLVVQGALENVGGALEQDVVRLMGGNITDAVGGLFIIPMLLFGALAFGFSVLSALFYIMGASSKKR